MLHLIRVIDQWTDGTQPNTHLSVTSDITTRLRASANSGALTGMWRSIALLLYSWIRNALHDAIANLREEVSPGFTWRRLPPMVRRRSTAALQLWREIGAISVENLPRRSHENPPHVPTKLPGRHMDSCCWHRLGTTSATVTPKVLFWEL